MVAPSKRVELPIDPLTPEVVDAVLRPAALPARVLLIASPGSGKTTRIPWALAQVTKGKVYVLEPRRIAAKLSAERVAEENGATLGGSSEDPGNLRLLCAVHNRLTWESRRPSL